MREKVGLIHRGAWGDLFVSTACLYEWIELHKDSPMVLIGSQKWLEIIDPKMWPQVQEIWISEDGWTAQQHLRSCGAWSKAAENINLLQNLKEFRAICNLRTESLRFAWAPFFARVPKRHGSTTAFYSWLYTNCAPWLGKDPLMHERERLLQVVEGKSHLGELESKWKTKGLPALISVSKELSEKFAQAQFKQYILINPTASRREKAWPSANFRSLIVALFPEVQKSNLSLRLIGAPSETDWLRECVPPAISNQILVLQPEHILDLAQIVGGAKLLISNTSSMQFISAGLNTPCLTLMGRSVPEIWGPLGPQDKYLKGNIDSASKKNIFAQEQEAFSNISVESVAKMALQMLGLTESALAIKHDLHD